MPKAVERDPLLASLTEDLKETILHLNRLYHPVYPQDPDRMKAIEARVAEMRESIAQRRAELAAAADA